MTESDEASDVELTRRALDGERVRVRGAQLAHGVEQRAVVGEAGEHVVVARRIGGCSHGGNLAQIQLARQHDLRQACVLQKAGFFRGANV